MKKIKTFFLLVVFAMSLTVSIYAEDKNENWSFTLGASYRSFDNIELKQFDFTSGENVFINGSIVDVGAGNYQYNVANSINQIDNVTLDNIEFQKATLEKTETNSQNARGILIKMSKEIIESGNLSVDFDLSLLTAFASDTISATATTSTFMFDITPNEWTNENFPAPGGGPDPDTTSERFPFSPQNQIDIPMSQVNARVNYDFDLDLYTIGIGVTIKKKFKSLNLTFGLGPSISIVNANIDRKAEASWVSNGNSFFMRNDDTDNKDSIRVGTYTEAGLEWNYSDKVAIGINGRYDWIPNDLNTDYANFKLSGFSSTLFLSLSF